MSPEWLKGQDIVFLGKSPQESRHRDMAGRLASLPNAKLVRCEYDLGTFWAKLDWNGQEIEGDVREIFTGDLADQMRGRGIVVDITTLPHPFFLALINQLKAIAPKRVYCTYAEPAEYAKVKDGNETQSDLSAGFGTLRILPSLVQDPAEGETLLVSFLGFEGERLKSLLENENSARRLLPILGFPAYRPGWHLRTMQENFVALRDQANHLPFRAVDASSPFEARNAILNVAAQNKDAAIKVALLGTRPHALGALLAHLAMPSIHLIYDHPIEKSQRSQGIANVHVYDVSRDLGCPRPPGTH